MAGAVSVAITPTATAATIDLGPMILKRSDLPAGFIVVAARTGPYGNRDVVREAGRRVAPLLRRYGRITGYRANYVQTDPRHGAMRGVFGFQASLSLYPTARRARAAMRVRNLGGCRQDGFKLERLRGQRPIGKDTVVCSFSPAVMGNQLRMFMVQWRSGRITASVAMFAQRNAASKAAVLATARMQNRHMAAALRA